MCSEESSDAEFWCPLGGDGTPARHPHASTTTPAEHASLTRLAAGDWLSDAQIIRLEELGLVERVFGQALLTRSGRSVLNIAE